MKQLERFLYYSAPHMWLQVADELKHTIDKLYETRLEEFYFQNFYLEYPEGIKVPSSNRSIILLMNFCFENLLKGILILRDVNKVKSGKLSGELKTHNVKTLAKLCKVELSKEEINFMHFTSEACINTGRYPIGLTKGTAIKIRVIDKHEYNIFNDLFLRIKHLLISEYKKEGWVTGLSNDEIDCKPGEFNYVELD